MKIVLSETRQRKFSNLLILLMICMYSGNCTSQNTSKDEYEHERRKMVETQIVARGIKDENVLNAMIAIPRHLFVPAEYIHESYADHPLPIGEGQTISQPYIVAYMTAVLELDKYDRVLEVGTGSGYQAAVLAEICDSVFTVEIFESLGKQAKKILKSLDYDNVVVHIGDGYQGWPEKSPFDAIIVTCSPSHIPQPLINQLAEEGRLIIPVGKDYSQELVLMEKKKGKLIRKEVLPVRFVPMINENGSNY